MTPVEAKALAEILIKRFDGLFSNNSQYILFSEWLRNIAGSTNTFDLRFLCGIATDLNGLVAPEQYTIIFEAIDYTDVADRENWIDFFDNAITKDSNLQFFTAQINSETITYGRVIRAIGLNKMSGLALDFEHDVNLIPPHANLKMDNSTNPAWNLYWTAPFEDLENICKDSDIDLTDRAKSSKSADKLIEKLGLGHLENYFGSLVLLKYPTDLGLSFHQPCVANSGFHDNRLFMPYKIADTFGRTRPCTGDVPTNRIKEQVHRPFTDPKEFQIFYIGKGEDIKIDETNIVAESYARYQESL
jgi:hypothetical protein